MDVEARIIALEERVMFLEHKVKVLEPKIDQALEAIVDLHDDVRAIRVELREFKAAMPEIIARAVAPLLRGRD